MKQLIVAVFMTVLLAGCAAGPVENLGESEMAVLQQQFKLMDEIGTEKEWQANLAKMKKRPAIVKELSSSYDADAVVVSDRLEMSKRARNRWKAVQLLGYVGDKSAIPKLAAIAKTPLPDPKDENQFQLEYRVRLRAVSGLEKLGAVAELTDIVQSGGMFRGIAGASLYELGVHLPGFRELDAKTVMGNGDPTNVNPNPKTRPVRRLPLGSH